MKFQECNPDDPMKLIMSLNTHRRHMGESQRGAIAAEYANATKADAGRMGAADQGKASVNLHLPDPVFQHEAAKLLGVSRSTVAP